MAVAVGVACPGMGVDPDVTVEDIIGPVPLADGDGEVTGGDAPGKKAYSRLSLAATTTDPSALIAM